MRPPRLSGSVRPRKENVSIDTRESELARFRAAGLSRVVGHHNQAIGKARRKRIQARASVCLPSTYAATHGCRDQARGATFLSRISRGYWRCLAGASVRGCRRAGLHPAQSHDRGRLTRTGVPWRPCSPDPRHLFSRRKQNPYLFLPAYSQLVRQFWAGTRAPVQHASHRGPRSRASFRQHLTRCSRSLAHGQREQGRGLCRKAGHALVPRSCRTLPFRTIWAIGRRRGLTSACSGRTRASRPVQDAQGPRRATAPRTRSVRRTER